MRNLLVQKFFVRPSTLLVLPLLLLVAGCATSGKKPKDVVFFPSPPDEPRIQYLTSFGSEGDLGTQGSFSGFVLGEEKIHRPIWKPYGLAAAPGTLYVCDTMPGNVGIIDLAKGRIHYLRPSGQGILKMPIAVSVAEDGTRYVSDTARGQVLMYDKGDAYLGALGKAEEMKPCGLQVVGDRIYIADIKKENHCVQVYDRKSHERLFTIPRDPNDEKARLFQPANLTVDAKGRVLVSDMGSYCVQIYDAEGKHLQTVGEQGETPGRFVRNKGIAVDRTGRFYVVDTDTTVVQLFDNEGRLLMFFGLPKDSGPAGLYLPAGVCVDYDNVKYFEKFVAPGQKLEYLIYVTNQVGPNKVSVFGFLKKS